MLWPEYERSVELRDGAGLHQTLQNRHHGKLHLRQTWLGHLAPAKLIR